MEKLTQTVPAFRFGAFELDTRTGELSKNGRKTQLHEQPFQILLALLEHPGELVTREKLAGRVWPTGTFVDFDRSLNKAVNKLRDALGDSADEPRFIETLPRRGYRFISSVEKDGEAAEQLKAALVTSRRVRLWPAVIRATVLVVLAAVGLGGYKWLTLSKSLKFQNVELTKLTDSGNVLWAAISPDGRYMAYLLRDSKGIGLWVRQVATHSAISIVPAAEAYFSGLTFSPDGEHIYYSRSDENHPDLKYLYTIPVLGGAPRRLIKDVDSPVSFSPDGRSFVFTRGAPRSLVEVRIANADGSGERLLATFHASVYAFSYPTWSPDGQTIAVSVPLIGRRVSWALEAISVADASVRELYSNPNGIGRALWLSRGDMLLVVLYGKDNRGQLWTISYPQGEAHRFTNDLADYESFVDITHDRRTVAAVEWTAISNIWIVPAGQTSKAQQVTSGGLPLTGVASTLQGKLLAVSQDGKLWTLNADGSLRARFTDLENVETANQCGRFVVVESDQTDAEVLTRIDADGTNAMQLISGNLCSYACSPDGKSVLYADWSYPAKISRIPIEGGAPVEITKAEGSYAGQMTISRDGRFLAYFFEDQTEPVKKLAVIPASGGAPVKVFDVPGGQLLNWSSDGKNLDYTESHDGVDNVWEQPLAGGTRRQLTKFASGSIFDFNWSTDGKQLLVARGEYTSDAVLLENIQ